MAGGTISIIEIVMKGIERDGMLERSTTNIKCKYDLQTPHTLYKYYQLRLKYKNTQYITRNKDIRN